MNIIIRKKSTYLRTRVVPITTVFRVDGNLKVQQRSLYYDGASYLERVMLEENERKIRRNRK